MNKLFVFLYSCITTVKEGRGVLLTLSLYIYINNGYIPFIPLQINPKFILYIYTTISYLTMSMRI